MAQATGVKSQVVIGFEGVFKTAPADGFLMPVNSCTVKASRPKNTAGTIRGNLNPAAPFDGNLIASGDIVVPVDSVAFWYWLRLAMGSPITTGTGPYVHTYGLGGVRPSFTLELQFTDLGSARYMRYRGCKISTMKIDMGGDGELVATLGVVGADYSIETAPFDATPTAVSMNRMKNSHLALTEGGSAIENAMSFGIDVNFNLDTENYCIGGAGKLYNILDGLYTVNGSLKALFEDTALILKAQSSTESSIVATFTNGAAVLAFTVPELQYQEDMPAIEGPKGVQVTLPFVAYYENASQATSMQVVLTNADEHA